LSLASTFHFKLINGGLASLSLPLSFSLSFTIDRILSMIRLLPLNQTRRRFPMLPNSLSLSLSLSHTHTHTLAVRPSSRFPFLSIIQHTPNIQHETTSLSLPHSTPRAHASTLSLSLSLSHSHSHTHNCRPSVRARSLSLYTHFPSMMTHETKLCSCGIVR